MYLVLFLVPKPTVVGTLSSVRRGDSIPFSSASSKTLEFPQPYKRSSNNQTMVSLYGNGVERVMRIEDDEEEDDDVNVELWRGRR
jgi:hypothetical protein